MANIKFDKNEGVWRTIGGRRIFIRTGKSIPQAMKESGKFKKAEKTNTEEAYKKYVDEKLNDDNYLQANRPNEYFRKMQKEANVVDKEDKKELNLSQRQIDEGNRLNSKAENGVRDDVKAFLSGKENYDGTREDFIRDLSDNWGVDRDKVEEILHDENIKHPRNFTPNQQKSIERNMPAGAKFSKMLEENNVKTFSDEIKEKANKENKYSGYQQYLRDRYGTENEDVVSTGYKNKKDLYQEYKNEVIRNTNNKRMEKGTTSLKEAYKKAFEEYKKKHPNTKLNLQKFIDMNEE